MKISIRKATVDDIPGIKVVLADIWPEETFREQAARRYADPHNFKEDIWIAFDEDDNAVAGFVACFLSKSRTGFIRYEVDLFAIRRVSQGFKLGQRLVKAAWQNAPETARVIRALVRVENIPAQKSFQKEGYAIAENGQTFAMYLWTPQETQVPPLSAREVVNIVPVDTLTYRGIWLENLQLVEPENQRHLVRQARAQIARENGDNTTALIPLDKPLPDDLVQSASLHGNYQWWEFQPRQTHIKRLF